ncbi:MAG: hypothetical protein ACE37F_03525 [Nannocystaceae bacterium]|nr:hypothetical protein [bacterium]
MKARLGCFLILSVLLGGCDDSAASSDSNASGTGTDTSPTASSTTTTTAGADDSSGQVDSTSIPTNQCEDDYHGNNSAFDLLDLSIDTTSTVQNILGDGVVSSPVEQGADELVVCGGEADYFSFDLACDSYVSIEIRKLEGSQDPPELYVYEISNFDPSNPQPIDSSTGGFFGFFLRPVQQKLSAGEHAIRVRPFVSGKRAYSLAVTVLPTQDNCA